ARPNTHPDAPTSETHAANSASSVLLAHAKSKTHQSDQPNKNASQIAPNTARPSAPIPCDAAESLKAAQQPPFRSSPLAYPYPVQGYTTTFITSATGCSPLPDRPPRHLAQFT